MGLLVNFPFMRSFTSWFLGAEKIEELVKLIGEDRLVYGTDFPYNGWERIFKDIENMEGGRTKVRIIKSRESLIKKESRDVITSLYSGHAF